jgi:hypothetical protein
MVDKMKFIMDNQEIVKSITKKGKEIAIKYFQSSIYSKKLEGFINSI